jgi:hypothetical protein
MHFPLPRRKVDEQAGDVEKVASDHHIRWFLQVGQDREVSFDKKKFWKRQLAVEHRGINGFLPRRVLLDFATRGNAQPLSEPRADTGMARSGIDEGD